MKTFTVNHNTLLAISNAVTECAEFQEASDNNSDARICELEHILATACDQSAFDVMTELYLTCDDVETIARALVVATERSMAVMLDACMQ